MSKNKYIRRYLVEWKERNQEHWFNSSCYLNDFTEWIGMADIEEAMNIKEV